MYSLEMLEHREIVQKEYVKLQTLVDVELEDSTFIWYSEPNFVYVTFDFFKRKRGREEDEEEEAKHRVVFKVEGSQSPPSFVPKSQINSEVQGSQISEPVNWSSESPQTP
jgi:hypothetical protein